MLVEDPSTDSTGGRSSEDRAGLVVRMWAEIESLLTQLAQIVGVGDERSMRSSPRGTAVKLSEAGVIDKDLRSRLDTCVGSGRTSFMSGAARSMATAGTPCVASR